MDLFGIALLLCLTNGFPREAHIKGKGKQDQNAGKGLDGERLRQALAQSRIRRRAHQFLFSEAYRIIG